jgi:hypothetical protein
VAFRRTATTATTFKELAAAFPENGDTDAAKLLPVSFAVSLPSTASRKTSQK